MGKIFQIIQIQIVTGIKAQANRVCNFCSLNKWGNCFFPVSMIVGSIRFCIKFNPIGPGFYCIFYHFAICIDKYRNTDPSIFKPLDHIRQEYPVRYRIPTGIGSNRIWWIWYKRNLCRINFTNQVYKLC